MAPLTRSFAGVAIVTTITDDISAGDDSIPIASSSGWPSGAGGKPFVAMLVSDPDDPGATREKVLVATRTGTTLTITSRGYDGTVAASFLTGATIVCVLDSIILQALVDHMSEANPEGHTDLLNAARHDVQERHTFGAAFPTPGTPNATGTAASAGTAPGPARSDHRHALDGSIAGNGLAIDAGALKVNVDGTTLEVSGDALQVKPTGIGATQLADGAVNSNKIGANAVISGKIADGAVNSTAKLADGIVTFAKMEAAAPRGYVLHDTQVGNSAGVTAGPVTVSGLSIPWTAPASRRYRATLQCKLQTDTNNDETHGTVSLQLDGAEIGELSVEMNKSGRAYGGTIVAVIDAPSAGAHTLTVRITRNNSNSGTAEISVKAGAVLLLEDIGGA